MKRQRKKSTPPNLKQMPPAPPAGPNFPPGDYRVEVVVIQAELTYIGENGKPTKRISTEPHPVFADRFGMTLEEILVKAGVKKEAL